MTTPSQPDFVASVDQMGAMLRSCASAVGEYRKGLVAAEIPPEVADCLVEDFAKSLHKAMWPPANPLAGLFPGASA